MPDLTLQKWLDFKRSLSQFILPSFEAVVVTLVLVNLVLWLPVLRVHSWVRWCAGLVTVAVALFLLPTTSEALHWVLAHPASASGTSVQAIVVLGRGSENIERVLLAEKLWHQRDGMRLHLPVVFSGSLDGPFMAAVARQSTRIPDELILVEGASRTTRQNALFTYRLLAPLNVRQVLLISDSDHLLRSTLTLRKAGFTVHPYTDSRLRLTNEQHHRGSERTVVLQEYLGLLAYGLRGWL